MQDRLKEIFKESIAVKEKFLQCCLEQTIVLAETVKEVLRKGKKILIFGNGGSAADAQHIAAEFVNRFKKERRPLAALALTTDTSILTSIANDYDYDLVFVKQIEALGQLGDIAWGISTSGNSSNVNLALKRAKELGLKTVALTGGNGGKMAQLADLSIIVPSFNTPRIQEVHITIGHAVCELVEEALFSDTD
ncbi:MAG: D-sedoheptulose 7-phosphate isomerase [Candidatus Desulfofervidaceae bacterium]|nr:D-sedoheptulose 7-phosphate isomerase [Candidatus Desulfofervidaceae bacterium]